jgi:hypothetical protein
MRLVSAAFILYLASCVADGAKARNWKDGVVVDAGSQRISEIVGSETTGRVDNGGNINASTTNTERLHDEDTYAIDAGDRFYIVSEYIRRMGGQLASFRLKRGVRLAPDSKVKYAIDRWDLYVLLDGKEHKLRIQRISMKATQ